MTVSTEIKETKIGPIPIDWEVAKLEKLVKITSGVSPSNLDLKEEGRTPFFKVNQLNTKSKYLSQTPYMFDNEVPLIPKGSVVFPKRGASIFTNKVKILADQCMVDTNLMCLEPDESINNYYLFSYLSYFELANIADTSSVPQINNKHINPLQIPLPPLTEQEKIAEVLSTVDDKIDSIENEIDQTRTLKKGFMQKLLTGQLSVTGKAHTFKDSKLGPIPKSWEVALVGNMASVTSGGTPSTSKPEYWTPDQIPWLSSGEVHKKYVKFTDRYISKLGLNNSSAKLVPPQTVLIALAGQGKTRGTVAITEIELTTNQSIGAILPCDNIHPYFLYHNLNGRYSELRKMSTGDGGRGGLNLAIIKSIPLALPSHPEQEKIAEILGGVDEKLEALEEKKEQYTTLKKGLMQKLLTGKIRVEV